MLLNHALLVYQAFVNAFSCLGQERVPVGELDEIAVENLKFNGCSTGQEGGGVVCPEDQDQHLHKVICSAVGSATSVNDRGLIQLLDRAGNTILDADGGPRFYACATPGPEIAFGNLSCQVCPTVPVTIIPSSCTINVFFEEVVNHNPNIEPSPSESVFGWTGSVLLLIFLILVALILVELDRMTYMELGLSAHIQQTRKAVRQKISNICSTMKKFGEKEDTNGINQASGEESLVLNNAVATAPSTLANLHPEMNTGSENQNWEDYEYPRSPELVEDRSRRQEEVYLLQHSLLQPPQSISKRRGRSRGRSKCRKPKLLLH